MDPLSLSLGVVTLLQSSGALVKFLKDAHDGYAETDRTIEELLEQIQLLQNAARLARSSINTDLLERQDDRVDVMKQLDSAFNACDTIVHQLQKLMDGVIGPAGKKRPFANVQHYLRLKSKEKEFDDLRQRLWTHQSIVQQHLNSVHQREANTRHDESIRISKEQHIASVTQRDEIIKKIAALSLLIQSFPIGKGLNSPKPLNEHFYLPKGVSSIYVGRSQNLSMVSDWLLSERRTGDRVQRRVVIFGLPGSGKTEFCCKLASDHKERFWGVFYVDASSSEHMKQDFAKIAGYGKVDPNERAAKNWLSTQGAKRPWLILIDNADAEDFPIEECYPDSVHGCILITTRNPRLRVQGTAGGKSVEFSELDEQSSVELLLNASGSPRPWAKLTLEIAGKIARTLGFLPLALAHAGTTILERALPLGDYLRFFEDSWSRVRKVRHDKGHIHADMTIYSSYELIHQGLKAKNTEPARDALDLLRILSFLHNQSIRKDIFLRAAANPVEEASHQQNMLAETAEIIRRFSRPPTALRITFRAIVLRIVSSLMNAWSRPVLPNFLSVGATKHEVFDQDRLGEALRELSKWSLISRNQNESDGSFSIHPAVHLWLRKRSQRHISSQAVWCHVAATILARSILMPPLGNNEFNEAFQRDILPHINQVRANEQEINGILFQNRKHRNPGMLTTSMSLPLNRERATHMIKFSLVYDQCGLLEEAAELQENVLAFVRPRLGNEHKTTIDLMLLLSRTYWKLTYSHKAATLQKEALETCLQYFGEWDPKTLMVMDAYGSSLWLQGRPLESMQWHQKAYEQLKLIRGEDHVDTLRAMGHMGRVVTRDWRWEDAIKIHTDVVAGFEAKLGPTNLDTLEAKDNLAMAYFDRTAFGFGKAGDLDQALELETFAFENRKEKLGREHIMTLWSGLNMARILGLRGQIDNALEVFYEGHNIALRNLGENHFGTLWGKTHLGRLLTYAKRYDDAETVLREVVDAITTTRNAPPEQRRAHPDRLLALFSLIKCRALMGKEDAETQAYREELKTGVRETFGEEHPSYKYLLDPKNMLLGPQGDEEDRQDSLVGSHKGPPDAVQLDLAQYGHIRINSST